MTDALGPRKLYLIPESFKCVEVNVIETKGLSSRCYVHGIVNIGSIWLETAMLKDTEHEAVVAQVQYLNNRLTEERRTISHSENMVGMILYLLADYNIPERT